LADLALSAGSDVKLYDINFDWRTNQIDIPKIRGDVLDARTLANAMKDVDVIVHLAGVSRVEDGEKDPVNCLHVNVEGGYNVAYNAAILKKRMVFGSSREVYGNPERFPVHESDPKKPISTYGVTKLAIENILGTLSMKYGLRYTILRFSNVYGSERDRPERVVPKFLERAIRGETLELYGGEQTLDFTFVDDVVSVIRHVVDNEATTQGQDFNVVSGRSTSIFELASLIKRLTNSESDIVTRSSRRFDALGFRSDPTKISNLMGEQFHMRSLEGGLLNYVGRMKKVIIARGALD
ncbi:MAG: NAD-dependent epimerase/dehydratase family protein, partial [Rhabdochlamydiaceae bacterium]